MPKTHRSRSLAEVIDKLIAATWKAPDAPGLSGEVQRAIDMVALYRLMTLAANESAPGEVRAIALSKLVCAARLDAGGRRQSGTDRAAPIRRGRDQAFRNQPARDRRPASAAGAAGHAYRR